MYIGSAIIITIIALLFCHVNVYESLYNGTEKEITGYVTAFKTDGNKVTLTVKAKEEIIVTYYAKSEESLKYIKANYKLGDNIKTKGTLTTIKDNRVFHLFNYRKYLYRNKIFYIFEATNLNKTASSNKLLFNMKQKIIDRIGALKYSGKSVKAFALGDPYLIDHEIMRTYQSNGISHLLALSGANVALLALILLWLLKQLKVKEIKRYILVVLVLLFYVFLANYSASIVRAFLFFTLLAINKVFYFNVKSLNVLLLTYCILVLYNPYYLYDLGFQFSFVISFYLLIFQTHISKGNGFSSLFKVSLVSFLVSLPITLYNFYQVNILAIIYNLFFVPLVSIIIYPLSLITIIIQLFDYPLFIFITIMENLSTAVDKIEISKLILSKPNILVIGLYYLIITLTLYGLQTKKYKPLLALIFIVVIHYNINMFNKYPSLTMIDVGQGDCFLIQLPKNKGNILIDTGGKLPYDQEDYQIKNHNYSVATNTTVPYLKSIGIKKLDYMIFTHGDYDHIGEAQNILNNFKVDNLILNDYELTTVEEDIALKYKEKVSFYKSDDILTVGNTNFYFLNPKLDLNENDNSLVMYFKLNKTSFLLMGDASSVVEEKIIMNYELNNIDILKIGHHGSATSTSDNFLKTIKPKYALISVGEKNNFGHPSKTVIYKLKSQNIKTYLTSKSGSLKITLTKRGPIFKACN